MGFIGRQSKDDDSVRSRLLPVVESLNLAAGWSIDEAVSAASRLTGRSIKLAPLPAVPGGGGKVCGLATRTPEFDIVWHRISSDPRRQAQIVGHELGHLILDHDPDSDEVDFHELANQLLGMDIPRGATTLGARGFTNYDSPEEYEAELFGSLLVTHPARHLRKSDGSRPATFRLF